MQSTICAALKESVAIRCESSIPTATPVNGTIQLELLQAFRKQRQPPLSYILINLDLSNYEVLWLPCQGHGTCLWNYLGVEGFRLCVTQYRSIFCIPFGVRCFLLWTVSPISLLLMYSHLRFWFTRMFTVTVTCDIPKVSNSMEQSTFLEVRSTSSSRAISFVLWTPNI